VFQSTPLWQDIWGEHLHHGLYPGGKPRSDHKQAQVDMVDAVLDWSNVQDVTSVLDVGCGVGGSSRHIARRFGASAKGVTLSPVQVQRAEALSAEAGLGDRCTFQVADALELPFASGSFDLVWSLESGEHMPDKRRFMAEMARVCKPGGCIILVTWCCRSLQPGETELSADEQRMLDQLCKAYYLPQWASIDQYRAIATDLQLQGIRTDDWSADVQPFWRAVIDTALTPRGVFGLLNSLRAGLGTIRGALVMPLMQRGLRRGLIKFNLLTATK
jgi:tocopherol O-methyltransferase